MIRIHFAGLDSDRRANALAVACGISDAGPAAAWPRRFERLYAAAPERWRAVPIEDAQVVVYPHEYERGEETACVAEQARGRGLPCLFFSAQDDATPADVPYGRVYRTSIVADRRTACERAMPALVDDLVREGGELAGGGSRAERARVGFCGFVSTPWKRALYRLSGRRDKVLGLELRDRAMHALERSPEIDCRFVRRSEFWGGSVRGAGFDARLQEQVRREYVANLFEADYTLCVRGKGNWSFRFYETLSAGRIPLFINTRCVLPFEDRIDWRRHCVWVEEDEIARAPEILRDFHEALSPDEFRAREAENRMLWEEWLSPEGFFARVVEDSLGGGGLL